jgi:hypothetical protein
MILLIILGYVFPAIIGYIFTRTAYIKNTHEEYKNREPDILDFVLVVIPIINWLYPIWWFFCENPSGKKRFFFNKFFGIKRRNNE